MGSNPTLSAIPFVYDAMRSKDELVVRTVVAFLGVRFAAKAGCFSGGKRHLELFSSNCAKRFVQDVKREDVLAFIRKLYELGV